MEESAINILDHNSLGELNNTFEYAADSVLKVQNAIAAYLKGVIEVMEQQLEIVNQKYQEAKDYLSSAQEELDDCLSSQEYDPETGEVYPSCSSERSNVRHAEAECKLWKERFETAKEVVSKCKTYKSDWDYQDPFFSGGDYHLELLGKQRTDEATKKLKKILEIVEEYLNIEFSSRGSRKAEEVEVLDKYDKRKIIEDSNYRVRGEQIYELNRHDAEGATRVAKCKNCGRPLSICICGYSRENIDLV